MKKKIILIIIILIAVCLFIFKDKLLTLIYPQKYKDIIQKYSQEYNVDKNLIFSVIKTESDFDNDIKSHKGAIGLMQLMENTAIEISQKIGIEEENMKEKLSDPETNIKIGTKYLSDLIEKYNNTELALTAYNAGAGNVEKWIEEKIIKPDGSDIEKVPFKETNKYVRTILRNYRIYEELYGE